MDENIHPLRGNSFLISVCEALRKGFSNEEIHAVYANKTLQHFDKSSIVVQYLPELETPLYNNYAFRRITLDVVLFSGLQDESKFQTWLLDKKDRLCETLRWINVEGVPHRYRSFESHIEQSQYYRFHFTVEYTLQIEYLDGLDEPLMIYLDENINVKE